jgi:lipopolysaccharide transport system ATP-binding protein
MGNVIKAENVSKMYRLGEVGTGTLSHDLNRWWHRVRGNEDPYLKIGESNDRSSKGSSEYVYALKDINFEVKQGEVLGIIGKNGAGKSTLLKLLSRVTSPTSGSIRIKGRTASLLEVGTGFHPELTGRENIFLNGAILGMTKSEIRSKFDEIVDFSGVERYIDTPVKRYSSGMYVRLAFAVAAHLDPEILIVDEVLAVGDAEFQKKALGKIKNVSQGEGRTVLFVSHNMAAVKSICSQGILLQNGEIILESVAENVVAKYLVNDKNFSNWKFFSLEADSFNLKEVGIRRKGGDYKDSIDRSDEVVVDFKFDNSTNDNYHFTLKIKGEDGQYCMTTSTSHKPTLIKIGSSHIQLIFPSYLFNEGQFYVDLLLVKNGRDVIFWENDALSFIVQPDEKPIGSWMGREFGYFRGRFECQLIS